MKFVLILVMVVLLSSCTDADVASLKAFGSPAKITCYSGEKVIYDGISTGRIATVKNSDGWEFKDASSGKFVRVSGPCVILN